MRHSLRAIPCYPVIQMKQYGTDLSQNGEGCLIPFLFFVSSVSLFLSSSSLFFALLHPVSCLHYKFSVFLLFLVVLLLLYRLLLFFVLINCLTFEIVTIVVVESYKWS